MAWNNVGDHFLGPGEAIRLEIGWDDPGEPEFGGADHGAQWIMADPISIDPADLIVRDHAKLHKPRRNHPGDPLVAYAVTIVNNGPETAHFSLQGGGNV